MMEKSVTEGRDIYVCRERAASDRYLSHGSYVCVCAETTHKSVAASTQTLSIVSTYFHSLFSFTSALSLHIRPRP